MRRGLLAAVLTTFAVIPSARADEPISEDEPHLLDETGEATTVVDAFDRGDPFDFHVFAGFEQRWKNAKIRRETGLMQPGLSTGGFTAATENVASYSQSTSIIHLGADIGLFRDLALVFRAPIIVADSRELGDLDGSSNNPSRLQDPNGQQMFTVPFKSPTRSGIDYIELGLNWAPFNQQRDRTKPTWVVGLAGQFGVGSSLHACNATAGGGMPVCPDPSGASGNRDPGISRGMWGIRAHTMISRRFGYVEPYTGFSFLAEFPQDRGDWGTPQNFKGVMLTRAPIVASMNIGLEVIPWEHRENFQRIVGDIRIGGIYHSAGREYSELFDALGSTGAGTLRSANPSAYKADPANMNGSIVDDTAPKVFFSGITDQRAYGGFRVAGSVTWQAGEYLKFSAGTAVQYNQSHIITGAEPCNPDAEKSVGSAGPCRTADPSMNGASTGVPNPNHRDAIDTPGRRFTVDDTTIVSLWINGTLMF
jgi:hypothetical protein